MTEYIKKEHALEAFGATFNINYEGWNNICREIKAIPPADVAPVVHATTTDAGWDEIYCQWKTCNHCQGDNVSMAIYCNWCGARMYGGERNV